MNGILSAFLYLTEQTLDRMIKYRLQWFLQILPETLSSTAYIIIEYNKIFYTCMRCDTSIVINFKQHTVPAINIHTLCRLVQWAKVFPLVNKFPAFYGNKQFITIFAKAHQLTLPWSKEVQSAPDLYSEGTDFKSHPGRWLPWPTFSWLSSAPPGKYLDSTLN
jgi:hypothetical protein